MKPPTPAFDIGSIVYLRVNPEMKGMVTGYLVRAPGISVYMVVWNDGDEKDHWTCELSDTKTFDTGVEGET